MMSAPPPAMRITLKLPAAIGARVHARTSQSSIHTDFDVRRDDRDSKNHLDGVIATAAPRSS